MSGSAENRSRDTVSKVSNSDQAFDQAPPVGQPPSAVQLKDLELKLQIEFSDQRSELEVLRARNAELRQRNSELRGLAEVGWQAELQLKKFHIVEADLADEMSELKSITAAREKKIEDQTQVLASLRESNEQQNAELLALRGQIEIQKSTVEDLGHQSRQKQDEIARLKVHAATAEELISVLKFDVETKVETVQSLSAEIEKMHEAIWEGELLIKKEKAIADDLRDELAELRAALSGRDGQLEASKLELASAQHRFQSQFAEMVENGLDLESQINEMRNLETAMANEIALLKANLEARDTEIETRRFELFDLEAKVSDLEGENQLKQLEIRRLSLALSDSQDALSEIKTEFSSLHLNFEEAQAEIANANSEVALRESTISEQSQRIVQLNDALVELNSVIEMASSEVQILRADAAVHVAVVGQLEIKLHELAREDHEISELEVQLANAKTLTLLANERCANAEDELAELSQKQTELAAALRVSQNEVLQLKSDLERTQADLDARVCSLKAQKQAFDQEKTELYGAYVGRGELLAAKDEDIEHLRTQMREQAVVSQAQVEAMLVTLQEEKRALEAAANDRVEAVLAEAREAKLAAVAEVEASQAEMREQQLAASALVETLREKMRTQKSLATAHVEALRADFTAKETADTADLKTMTENLNQQNSDLADANRELRALNQQLQSKHEQLKNGEAKLKERAWELATEQSLRRASETEVSRLEMAMKSLQTKFDSQLISQVQKVEAAGLERDTMKQILASNEVRMAADERRFDEQCRQLKLREAQLKNYAAAISQEKSEVWHCSKRLAEEIQSARTLHPLKDYLALTEFELTKLEIQMKKTPSISADRPRLEGCFTQMIEQRNFLKKAIADSQGHLDQQAAALLQIVKSDAFAVIPPPPPAASW